MDVSRVGGSSINVQGLVSGATARISSTFGQRQSAAASGTSQAEALAARMRGIHDVGRNLQDGISLTQAARKGLDSAQDTLSRLRDLAVQARSGDLSDSARAEVASRAVDLRAQVDQIGAETTYNGAAVLSGALGGEGRSIATSGGGSVAIKIDQVSQESLGISGISLDSAEGAEAAVGAIDAAMSTLNDASMSLMATEARLATEALSANQALRNFTAGDHSGIRGLQDGAVNLVGAQLRGGAGGAMVAQANMDPQSVLRLLQ